MGDGVRYQVRGKHIGCLGVGVEGGMSDVQGALYSEVQCIMGNGHTDPPPPPVDKLTDEHKRLKTLTSLNPVGGR